MPSEPWTSGVAKCRLCDYEWVAACPVEVEDNLECPECGHMAGEMTDAKCEIKLTSEPPLSTFAEGYQMGRASVEGGTLTERARVLRIIEMLEVRYGYMGGAWKMLREELEEESGKSRKDCQSVDGMERDRALWLFDYMRGLPEWDVRWAGALTELCRLLTGGGDE